LDWVEGCRQDLPEHQQIDLPLVVRREELVDEVDEEKGGDGMCHGSISRKADDSSESFVEQEEAEEIDQREVHCEVKDLYLYLLRLDGKEGRVVCVLKGEELDIINASRSPNIERDGPHEEQQNQVPETDEDGKGWVLRDVSDEGRGGKKRAGLDHPDVLSESLVICALRDRPEEQNETETDFE
jgi:hypothetical protein